MESKGHSAAFLEIRKKSYLGVAFRGPREIWLGCKLNPREYGVVLEKFAKLIEIRKVKVHEGTRLSQPDVATRGSQRGRYSPHPPGTRGSIRVRKLDHIFMVAIARSPAADLFSFLYHYLIRNI